MTQPFLGEIKIFGGNFAPYGYAFCAGQMMPIVQYSALFSILGTTFGGNGTSTFQLPDLRSRAPLHWGQGNGLSDYVIGEASGFESVTVLQSNMPNHSHPGLKASSADGTAGAPAGNTILAGSAAHDKIYSTNAPNVTLTAAAMTTGLAGGNQPHENRQPYLVVNFIIALVGIFPSRN